MLTYDPASGGVESLWILASKQGKILFIETVVTYNSETTQSFDNRKLKDPLIVTYRICSPPSYMQNNSRKRLL